MHLRETVVIMEKHDEFLYKAIAELFDTYNEYRELRACKQVSSLNMYKYGINCFVKIKKRVEALYLRLCRVVTFLMILYEKTDVQFHCNE